jgi:hypothetical protein
MHILITLVLIVPESTLLQKGTDSPAYWPTTPENELPLWLKWNEVWCSKHASAGDGGGMGGTISPCDC